jgi:hypothetical protein
MKRKYESGLEGSVNQEKGRREYVTVTYLKKIRRGPDWTDVKILGDIYHIPYMKVWEWDCCWTMDGICPIR